MAWIVVHDWRRFQHYKDRAPRWIKTYTELHHNEAFLNLTGNRRAILLSIWLEYAITRQELSDNTASLSRRFALKVTTRDLQALNHAGFITISASKPLASGYQVASPEVEREEEKEPKAVTSKDHVDDLEPETNSHQEVTHEDLETYYDTIAKEIPWPKITH